ncbi:MAG: ATP-dependent Clp protease proteolytic subunit, partial [Bacteroidota bacterium]|nr:ATP-dependent Clp protease proteolytic subunit [Bacteroidota bacterium]
MNNRKEFLKYAVHHHGMSSHTVEDYISATHSPVSGPDSMTRTVIEERPMPFREVDVFSRLMADRIIFLGTGVDDY